MVSHEFNIGDLMREGVPGDDQPAPVAVFVEPEFPDFARRIVAQVQVVVKEIFRPFVTPVGPVDQGGISEMDELGGVLGPSKG